MYPLVSSNSSQMAAATDRSQASTSGSRWRIVSFVAKVLAFYGIWYILYDLWLLPDGTVDRWLSLNVAWVSGGLLDLVGIETLVRGRVISLVNTPGVQIANGCNGLTTLGLFVGFVLAYPGSARRRLWFIPLGIAVVYATNVLRVIAMLLTQKYWPVAFDPLHGFGLTTIFYVVVFALWMVWANYGQAGLSDRDASSADRTKSTPAVSSS